MPVPGSNFPLGWCEHAWKVPFCCTVFSDFAAVSRSFLPWAQAQLLFQFWALEITLCGSPEWQGCCIPELGCLWKMRFQGRFWCPQQPVGEGGEPGLGWTHRNWEFLSDRNLLLKAEESQTWDEREQWTVINGKHLEAFMANRAEAL